MRVRAVGALAPLLLAVAASGLVAGSAQAAQCAGRDSDFNADGITDMAIGQPGADVGGVVDAGAVWIVLGGGKGRVMLTQGMPGVGGFREPGDRFGEVVEASLGLDGSSCAGLVVGVPGENVGTVRDAGVVHVIHGSPSGIGRGQAPDIYRQGMAGFAGAPEAGDRFGAAVAVGPFGSDGTALAVGVPGEDLGAKTDAGAIHYQPLFPGGTVHWVSQSSPGVPGGSESGDRFGAAIALGARTFVVGAPGEDVGAIQDAGAAWVFRLSAGAPKVIRSLNQDTRGVLGAAERGDAFGAAVTAIGLVDPASSDPVEDSDWIAIGVPGEDIGSVKDAGMVNVGVASASGWVVDHREINQNSVDVAETAEPGDRMGATLHTHARPGGAGNPVDTLLLVGAPGETRDGAVRTGLVQMFHLQFGNLGHQDSVLGQGLAGLAGPADSDAGFGTAISTAGSWLLIGAPGERTSLGRAGAVYATSLIVPDPGEVVPDPQLIRGTLIGDGTFGRAIG